MMLVGGLVQAAAAERPLAIHRHKAPAPRKAPTAQQVYQQELAAFIAERTRLSTVAKQALGAEAAREKAGDCPNAGTTVDEEKCLGTENKITEGNYETLVNSLRAELSLPVPRGPEEASALLLAKPAVAPAGQSSAGVPAPGAAASMPGVPEKVAAFDKAEGAWRGYREQATGLAYLQFKGGTEAPVFKGQTEQALIRSHMREIGFVFDFLLGNH